MALCQMKLCLVNLYKYTYLFKIIKQDLYIHTYILVFIILWKWGLGLMWRNWNWQAVQILVDIIGIHLHANTLGKGVNSPLMRRVMFSVIPCCWYLACHVIYELPIPIGFERCFGWYPDNLKCHRIIWDFCMCGL